MYSTDALPEFCEFEQVNVAVQAAKLTIPIAELYSLAKAQPPPLRGMAWVQIVERRLLGTLRCHLGGVGRSGNAARPQQLALIVIFGLLRFNTIDRTLFWHSILFLVSARSARRSCSPYCSSGGDAAIWG